LIGRPEHPPALGELVQVRLRRWLVGLVEEVASSVAGQSPLVQLAWTGDDAQGEALQVPWDYKPAPRILKEEGWRDLSSRGFDPPRLFAAFLRTLPWSCVTATDPNLFQVAFMAGIKIDAYQMEPLCKALRLPRINLFIARDVGLGKTIEAGSAFQGLGVRQRIDFGLVVCKATICRQWRDELWRRFGLTFEIGRREFLARRRQERGCAVNPLGHPHSVRYLPSVLDPQDRLWDCPKVGWDGAVLPTSRRKKPSLKLIALALRAARKASHGQELP
jgi:hypothetical protein